MISTHGYQMTGAHYARLGRQECEKIHEATVEILERTGVDVHDPEARDILVDGGAEADGYRIRISEYMISRALQQAPKRITLTIATEMSQSVLGDIIHTIAADRIV